ncbi:MAG TPA: outer membrane protein transport protein [Byssovorax sp.]|jgi:long-chain fatty acid transport protein
MRRLASATAPLPRALIAALGSVAASLVAAPALASSGVDSPENGVVQMGRGSAWVAKADDPLAAHYNPAGLANQATGVHLGASLMFASRCFTRVDPNGQPISPGQGLPAPGTAGGPTAATCANGFTPNPQLAFAWRITPKLALGVAVVAPHAVGDNDFGETVSYVNSFGSKTAEPAPNRYLLASSSGIIIEPTISVAYAPIPGLSFGAGFVWGVVTADDVTFAESVSARAGQPPTDDFSTRGDARADLSVKDLFVPGFVLGVLWSPTSNVDVGGAFKYLTPVDAHGDLTLTTNYFAASGQPNSTPCATCTVNAPGAGHLHFDLPAELRIGTRFHVPRANVEGPKWSRREGHVADSMSQDLFDVEVDLTWAHNSPVQTFELRFPSGANAIPVPPGTVPANGDIIRNWRDVIGARVGGDYVVLPNRLAVRGGGWFETKGQDDKDLQLDFDLAQKFGLALGATLRLGPVDVSVAYQHTFIGTLDNCTTTAGKTTCDGEVHALSGDVSAGFRSRQPVNDGSLEESMNEVALGGTLRF